MKTDLEEVITEIHEYLIKNDWTGKKEDLINDSHHYIHKGEIIDIDVDYFIDSPSKKSEMFNNKPWDKNNGEYYDKYFLEYIGHILRKHKIKEVWMSGEAWKYQSDKWIYEDIKRI